MQFWMAPFHVFLWTSILTNVRLAKCFHLFASRIAIFSSFLLTLFLSNLFHTQYKKKLSENMKNKTKAIWISYILRHHKKHVLKCFLNDWLLVKTVTWMTYFMQCNLIVGSFVLGRFSESIWHSDEVLCDRGLSPRWTIPISKSSWQLKRACQKWNLYLPE